MSVESINAGSTSIPATEKSFETTLGGVEPKPLKPGDQIILRTEAGEHIGTVIVGKKPQNLTVSLYQDMQGQTLGSDSSRSLEHQYGPSAGASLLIVANPNCDGPMLDVALHQYQQVIKVHQPEVLSEGRLEWVMVDSHGQPGAQSNSHYDFVLGSAPDKPVDSHVPITVPPGMSLTAEEAEILKSLDIPDTVFNPGAVAKNVWLMGCQILANQSDEQKESYAYFDGLQRYCDEMNVNVIENSTPSALVWGRGCDQKDVNGDVCAPAMFNQGPGGNPFRFSPCANPQMVMIDATRCDNGLQTVNEASLPYNHIYAYCVDRQNADPEGGLPPYDMTNLEMVKPHYHMFDGEILVPHHREYTPYPQTGKTTITMQGDVEK